MKIAVINYNTGNIKSFTAALERLDCETVLTSNHEQIISTDKVIFPGVGHAGAAMKALSATGLNKLIPSLSQPVLGICLGMQLMCGRNEEGNTDGLNIFDVPVLKFKAENAEKIPHMGWNNIFELKSNLFCDVPENSFAYFVHSYMIPVFEHTAAKCNYIKDFSASIHKNNFYGTQFHPEKSASAGIKILENFIKL